MVNYKKYNNCSDIEAIKEFYLNSYFLSFFNDKKGKEKISQKSFNIINNNSHEFNENNIKDGNSPLLRKIIENNKNLRNKKKKKIENEKK